VRDEKVWIFHPENGAKVPFFRIHDPVTVSDPWGATYRLSGGGDGVKEQIDWLSTGGLAAGILALAIALPFAETGVRRRFKVASVKRKAWRPRALPNVPSRKPAPFAQPTTPLRSTRTSDVFLSDTEKRCLSALAEAGGDRLLVFPKVLLPWISATGQKGPLPVLDFLLCHPGSLEPFAAIQLIENRNREQALCKALENRLLERDILFEPINPIALYDPAKLKNLTADLLRRSHRPPGSPCSTSR